MVVINWSTGWQCTTWKQSRMLSWYGLFCYIIWNSRIMLCMCEIVFFYNSPYPKSISFWCIAWNPDSSFLKGGYVYLVVSTVHFLSTYQLERIFFHPVTAWPRSTNNCKTWTLIFVITLDKPIRPRTWTQPGCESVLWNSLHCAQQRFKRRIWRSV